MGKAPRQRFHEQLADDIVGIDRIIDVADPGYIEILIA